VHIIMGATGHIGGHVVDELLARGEEVGIVTRDASTARIEGVEILEASTDDVPALRAAFRRGTRAFLLNPPADPSGDPDAVERASAAAIVEALEGSGLEKVVAQSTYGAQPGDRLGDLGVLWEFEEALRAQPIPAAINRGAYFMTNWDAMVQPARDGVLPSMYPADFVLPMVSPRDLGRAAAERLLSGTDDTGWWNVEGPARHTPADVAASFASAVGREVEVAVTPPEDFVATYRELGFSEAAAESFAGMARAALAFEPPREIVRGEVGLDEYIRALVAG
jgi:uncharacterized protein YbjT (DUF2867 family)